MPYFKIMLFKVALGTLVRRRTKENLHGLRFKIKKKKHGV